MKSSIKSALIIIIVISLANYFSAFINPFTEGLFKSYAFETQQGEFRFQTMPSKGRDVKMMERQFQAFKSKNPSMKDLKLFRTFKRNPFKFWNWYDYLTSDNYTYGFKSAYMATSLKGP